MTSLAFDDPLKLATCSKASYPFRQGTESSHSESDHLTIKSDLATRLKLNPPTPVSMQNGGTRSASTGREPPFYADKTHGRLRSYFVFYGIVGPFWFPPLL